MISAHGVGDDELFDPARPDERAGRLDIDIDP
jgi:hypothetical protein